MRAFILLLHLAIRFLCVKLTTPAAILTNAYRHIFNVCMYLYVYQPINAIG